MAKVICVSPKYGASIASKLREQQHDVIVVTGYEGVKPTLLAEESIKMVIWTDGYLDDDLNFDSIAETTWIKDCKDEALHEVIHVAFYCGGGGEIACQGTGCDFVFPYSDLISNVIILLEDLKD